MKIAVPYSDGQVFQHFGKSEQFKIYDTIDDEIISSEIVDTSGSGHSALADFLKEKGAGVLICGGIGSGAKMALAQKNISVFGGVTGETRKVVEDYLAGTLLFNANAECADHHHHDHENCGEHDHHCGGHCGH